jgi:hypothetical protein
MIYKTLLAFIAISLLSAFHLKEKNQKGNLLEKNLDSIPIRKVDTASTKKSLNKYESSFIVSRDRMRKYFKTPPLKGWDDAIDKRQNDSVYQLDKELKFVFKDVPLFKKLPKSYWEINNTNLNDEPLTSYDMLDGLVSSKAFDDSSLLFVTSNNLFYRYFKKDNITSLESLSPQKIEKIINATFYNDAVFTNFISNKLPSDSTTNAYAILGVGAQDYPFAAPNMLYILISKDGYTYIKEKDLRKNPLKEIPICEKLKDSASVLEGKYLRDTKLQEKYINRIVRQYCNCYLINLKYTKQYPKIQKLITDTYSDLQNRIK